MVSQQTNHLASFAIQVERVYITRGDNSYNHNNALCDKAVGVVIDKDIYWLKSGGIANISEVRKQLALLNIDVLGSNQWGVLGEDGSTAHKRVTRISIHQEEVFDKESKFMQRTITKRDGSIWWDAEELAAKFFKI